MVVDCMDYLNLTNDQRYQLAKVLATDIKGVDRKRLQSIELCDQGLSISMISRLLKIDFNHIHVWIVLYKEEGLEGLLKKPATDSNMESLIIDA